MSTPASETFGQARQGSVAAIIQVLNERLSDIGIRTRAVVADGMLQLLCEAASTEQLEKQTVVSKVREILESISPHRISKVKINSRIVKEEQLLWLEEINRDPENALLWSEIITLKRPFFVKRWIRDRNLKPAGPIFRDITEPDPSKNSLSKKLVGGSALALLLLATGWIFREDISQLRQSPPTETTADTADGTDTSESVQTDLPPLPAQPSSPTNDTTATDAGERTADITPQTPPPAADALTNQSEAPPSNAPAASSANGNTPANAAPSNPPSNSGATADAFAEAVRIANKASEDGQTATSAAEWLDLAARWQRASDLMAQIPDSSEQYDLAAERVQSYASNSQAALAQAAAQQ
ncbi:MAG: hypothetical protein AAGB19_23490 [Cyanobacteria bacterium P01_F01_bin.3]